MHLSSGLGRSRGFAVPERDFFPRYYSDMTGLLETVLKRVESLSQEEQDSIASRIMRDLDEEEGWEQALRDNPSPLQAMAREAIDEHRRGETRVLDELFR